MSDKVTVTSLAGIVNEAAVERGEQEIPPEFIAEILDGGKREAWVRGHTTLREIYELAAQLQATRATKH